MVTGWRRAFCTSIPKDHEPKIATDNHTTKSPRFGPKFSFFSSSTSSSQPSTPRSGTPPVSDSPTLRCRTTTAAPPNPGHETPRLHCKTTTSTPTKSPRLILQQRSCSTTPSSSPRSPSAFSLLKNSLRLTKITRCGICIQNVKSGQGTAIFTAECSHSFHFPCIASHAAKTTTKGGGALNTCPVCGSHWKEAPLLAVPVPGHSIRKSPPSDLRMYDDDEPLMSPVSGIRFNTIPESEEEAGSDTDTDTEFPGFFSDPVTPRHQFIDNHKGVDVMISPDAAVVAVGRSYETYAVLLTVRAPPAPPGSRRSSVDLVAVLDVGGDMTPAKLLAMKRAMRAVISSLSSNDRLSIVGFSSGSKRLLPLRRMTPSGKRSARRIIDALNIGQGSCVNDALRKAAKVLQDRKENNHFASIILLDGHDDEWSNNNSNHSRRFQAVSSTRFSHMEIPVHTFRVGEELYEEVFVKSVNGFLSVVVLDLRFQLGLASGSAPAEIAAVYSCTGRPGLLSSGLARLGDLYSEEEREILVELKVPAASIGRNHLLSVRCFHKEPSSKQPIYGRDQSVIVPRPHTLRSSDPTIQRLRGLFVMTRAVAESRRLLSDRNDLAGAERLLASARAVLGQPSFKLPAAEEFRRRVEAELAEVRWRRQTQPEEKRRREKESVGTAVGGGGGCCLVDEKGEPLTPTSAWKAAERLAKVAMMRKSLNRVSDLHGFEDARF